MKGFEPCEGHITPNGFFNTSTVYIGRGISVLNGDVIIKVPAKEVNVRILSLHLHSSSKSIVHLVWMER